MYFLSSHYFEFRCRCDSCHNTLEESYPGGLRHNKIKECMTKRADAFHVREVKSAEDEGCKCKKSHCLKKYCQVSNRTFVIITIS